MFIQKIRYLCLLLLCWMVAVPVMAQARLESVEIKQHAGNMSLNFKLDQNIRHRAFTLTNPDRVVVDFENTQLGFSIKNFHGNTSSIRLMRTGYPSPHVLRLVFEVHDLVQMRSVANAQSRYFAVDISRAAHSQAAVRKNSPSNPISRVPSIASVAKPSASERVAVKNSSLRDVIVVVDPGHGGKDPGALGPSGIQEKIITLSIARHLKAIVDKQPGMRAVLTRDGDYYVGLRERLRIARKYSGDVFIAIHADAFHNPSSSGASVFALSQRGATSEAARWLAAKENNSELGGVNLKALDDDSGLVRTVLIDLSQTATISASLKIGDQVLNNLHKITKLHERHVDQARFMVLKSPDIPSILVETGFISNPREAVNLMNTQYQVKVSQAIFQGMKNYFWEYPPHQTRLEAMLAAHSSRSS